VLNFGFSRVSLMAYSLVKRCVLCGKPLLLESCVVDDKGGAVHEECYVKQLAIPLELPDPPMPSAS
jgi:hypothetical protein